jgi:gamma-soluble NSF attachment protein
VLISVVFSASKSLFKWKPDWDQASKAYEQAGNAFKNAKNWHRARDAYRKAAEAFAHADSYVHYQAVVNFTFYLEIFSLIPSIISIFMAAKCNEQAALMAMSAQDPKTAALFYRDAAKYYMEHGSGSKSAEVSVKCAKVTEEFDPVKALQMFDNAVDTLELEDKEIYSADAFRECIAAHMRQDQWAEALAMAERQAAVFARLDQPHNVCKANLAQLILCLRMGDSVEADKRFNGMLEDDAFLRSEECKMAEGLLRSYTQGLADEWKRLVNHQVVSFLDPSIVRMVRQMNVENGIANGLSAEDTNLAGGVDADDALLL